MWVNGKISSLMEKGKCILQMDLYSPACFLKVSPKDKEDSYMRMEFIMKVKFIKGRHKAEGSYIIDIKITYMKDIGIKIFLMDKGPKNGMIRRHLIKASSAKGLKKDLGSISRKMNLNMREILKIIR